MSDSNSDNLPKIPEPSDPGISGIQKDTQLFLSVPDNYPSGGIDALPFDQAYKHFITNSPATLGSGPQFIFGIYQESVWEKKRLEIKLQGYETKISTLSQEVSELRVKDGVLRTTLNAESLVKLMRNASITVGMAVLALGFKLTEQKETNPVGIGLMVAGAVLAAFGWFSRAAKEVE